METTFPDFAALYPGYKSKGSALSMIAATPMFRKSVLLLIPLVVLGNACSRGPTYPDLRDSHDPELQAEMDAALADRPRFWDRVKNVI